MLFSLILSFYFEYSREYTFCKENILPVWVKNILSKYEGNISIFNFNCFTVLLDVLKDINSFIFLIFIYINEFINYLKFSFSFWLLAVCDWLDVNTGYKLTVMMRWIKFDGVVITGFELIYSLKDHLEM